MASRNMAMLYGLGGKIRETRNRIGLLLTDLSVAVGSDKSALAKIERGERVPRLETVRGGSAGLPNPIKPRKFRGGR